MILQDKITQFINRAQTKIADIAVETALDLHEAYSDNRNIKLSNELTDVIVSLQDDLLDWTDYDKELVVDYYNYKAELNDIALVNYNDLITYISNGGSTPTDTSWIDSFNALTLKVNNNYSEFLSEVARLDLRIDNFDLSGLIPQSLLDKVDANTLARHTHTNKAILDNVTQGHLDAIGLNTDHRNNSAIHVTSVQKTSWDAKVSAQALIDGLAGKSNVGHTHLMSEIDGLIQALNDIQPEKGDKGDDGASPTISLGTVTIGEELSITVDDTDPLNVIFNFVIPVAQDGEDFHIDVFGNASERLKTIYNDEPLGFSYMGIDNGYLYFRKPTDSGGLPVPATTSTGWFAVKFMGSNGWSPNIGTLSIDDNTTVMVLKGWIGGSDEANRPEIGNDPNFIVYLSPNGFTYNLSEAVNIKGQQGLSGPSGKIMFPDESGTFADRATHDAELRDFVFLDTDAGIIYRKLSDSVGDWSQGFQWKGDQGDIGPPGPSGGIAVPVFSDSEFKITGSLDDTKIARFQNENIATNTERVFEFPDKNGTFALLDDVNKYTESVTSLVSPKNGDRWVNTVNGIEYTWFGNEAWISL